MDNKLAVYVSHICLVTAMLPTNLELASIHDWYLWDVRTTNFVLIAYEAE